MSTFTAAVVTLSALAINHYVGIVYPLHRNAITPRVADISVVTSYFLSFTLYLVAFTVFPGGLRAPLSFDFFNPAGCQGNAIYKNNYFRLTLVGPFIFFIVLLMALYIHILIHMRHVSRDPLLNNNNMKRNNTKLLVTIALLAGSACLGWLPTVFNFLLPLLVEMPRLARLCLGILAQLLHVVKLIFDAFIYATRLIEIRYAMWTMNQKLCRLVGVPYCSDESDVPPKQFKKYLSETTENRSVRSKRVKSEFQNCEKKRVCSEKQRKTFLSSSNLNHNKTIDYLSFHTTTHQPIKMCKSVPSVVVHDEKQGRSNSNTVTVQLSEFSSANFS